MQNDGITFEAAGVSYRLRYDVNALCDLEDQTGVSVNDIGQQLGKKLKLGFVRACFWAGLRGDKPDLTVPQAGEVIGALGIERAGELLTTAMSAAFPSTKDQTARPPQSSQTGSTS